MKIEKTKKHKEKIKKRNAKYYETNRLEVIEKTKYRLKKNNYVNEKTPKQREIRNIKRKTRLLHPLEHCEFCGDKATEHHHNTIPIEINKFNFVCHKCHKDIHKLKGGKQQNAKNTTSTNTTSTSRI